MSKINIQDQLLYQARRERLPIKIFLLRGLQLIGRISAYDMYSVLLESQGRLQLIFKHAISTIEFPEKIKISAQEGSEHPARPGDPRDSRDPRDPRERPPMRDRYSHDQRPSGDSQPAGEPRAEPDSSPVEGPKDPSEP